MSYPPRVLMAAALVCALSPACAYMQQKRSQENLAESLTPEGVQTSQGGAGTWTPVTVGKLRVYAGSGYRAQHSGWENDFRGLVDDVNALLEPGFQLRIDVVEALHWERQCPQNDLDACLQELARLDPAEDVDWVVGLVTSLPRFVNEFDDLGRAYTPGKHWVMRGLNDVAERDAIDQVLHRLDASERRRLYRRRLAHKQQIVWLHEWAHTLGALHVREPALVMAARYDTDHSRFGDPTQELLRRSLPVHLDSEATVDAYVPLRDFLAETTWEGWVAAEREDLVARLTKAIETGQAQSQPVPAARMTQRHEDPRGMAAGGEFDVELVALSPSERTVYVDLRDSAKADTLQPEDWDSLYPLSQRYPDNYPIQHLTCTVAMRLNVTWEATQTICQHAIQLHAQAHGGPAGE